MKHLFLCAVIMLASVAHADNEPVPTATPFNALPTGAKLLVGQRINMSEIRENSYLKSLGDGVSIWTTDPASRTLESGQTLGIRGLDIREYFAYIALSSSTMISMSPGDIKKIKSVEDFNRKFAGIFSVVWNDPEADPFPGVPEDVKQDLLMTRVLAAIKADKHVDALPDFARIEKLGGKQPESFYYYYVVALDKAGRSVPAKERGTAFLKTYGKTSKYYNDVLAIMVK